MYAHILVPVDGSPTSRNGLAEAILIARANGSTIRLLHVVDELSFALGASGFATYTGDLIELLREGGQAIVAEAEAQVKAAGVPVDSVLRDSLSGRVCDHVLEEARRWPADLIVIGTHGRRGVGRFLLGSDAEQVLRSAVVPVLLVRGTADDTAGG